MNQSVNIDDVFSFAAQQANMLVGESLKYEWLTPNENTNNEYRNELTLLLVKYLSEDKSSNSFIRFNCVQYGINNACTSMFRLHEHVKQKQWRSDITLSACTKMRALLSIDALMSSMQKEEQRMKALYGKSLKAAARSGAPNPFLQSPVKSSVTAAPKGF